MALKDDFNDLTNKVNELSTLLKVGFIILLVMVGAIIVSAVLFEIQTINQSNQQIIDLLKE